ncbi:MAG: phage portal protein, partial [Chitinophagaceae bacterium]
MSLKSSINTFLSSIGIPSGDQTKNISAPSPEGSWRGPFFGQGELGGWHSLDQLSDGWQRNLDITGIGGRRVPAIYGCIMAIARAISQCDPIHVRRGEGKNTRVTNSAAYRVMNKPNEYQTTPVFILNLIATALFDGEAFAIGYRNDRHEITEMHQLLRGYCRPYVAEDGAVFYAVGNSDLAKTEPEMLVPARDIIHLRFFTPRSPLIGESAIVSAAVSAGLNIALSSSQFVFYSNMNRPSGILSTEQTLTKEQAIRLREAFDAQSASLRQGGLPVLSNGLKFIPMGMTSQDAQLVDAQRMTVEDICRVFGVPPPM